MGVCTYCNENERESFWASYCTDCALLRRMLIIHEPSKCVEILKRCLIRNQIDNKIKLELKGGNDLNDYDKPLTRKQKNELEVKKLIEK